ncbi:MAG: hypothetical protein HY962_14845 [Ignavibacteriae bacterium]|nr:hypothetical protein [Ignavibacteriota bacterium]
MYHVTLHVAVQTHLFGLLTQEGVVLSAYGRIAEEELLRSESIRAELRLDTYVIMPDHIHAIIRINHSMDFGLSNARRSVHKSPYLRRRANDEAGCAARHRRNGPLPRTLGAFVAGYKSLVTRRIREASGSGQMIVWQRNYHDKIIRSLRMLRITRRYIRNNPAREWQRLVPK